MDLFVRNQILEFRLLVKSQYLNEDKARQVKFECSAVLQPGSTALTFYSAREHTALHSQPEF